MPTANTKYHRVAKMVKNHIDILVDASKDYDLSRDDLAMVLAIARVESGFNPDAAAGTTSASGLGQFTDATALSYDISSDEQRFNAKTSAEALVRHYLDNKKLAAQHYSGRDLYEMIYAYHHDGPALKYGGREISRSEVMPKYDIYLKNICGGVMD